MYDGAYAVYPGGGVRFGGGGGGVAPGGGGMSLTWRNGSWALRD
jgi:hypothetical protein